MTQLSAGAGIRGGSLRFGPVCPLIDRTRPFRQHFIAAMGLEHASSVRYELAGALTYIDYHSAELFKHLGVPNIADIELKEIGRLRTDLLMTAYRGFEDRQGYYSLPYTGRIPALFDEYVANLNYLSANLLEGDTASSLRVLIDQISEERTKHYCLECLNNVSKFVLYLRDVFEDRRAFLEGDKGSTSTSFDDVREGLEDFWRERKLPFEVTDDGGSGLKVEMPPSRLFSLFNNLVSNGFVHGRPKEPIRVNLAGGPGFVFSVANSGGPIPAGSFEEYIEGYPRLFTLRKKEKRVPIGMAEIWDIIAIARGWLMVDTSPERTSVTVSLPRSSD
ncbi:MAG: hypothetical protein WC490_02635 [Candidatus Margulisiibacteriota bacterium]